MKRVGGWLGYKAGSSSKPLTALEERRALEEAMAAAGRIMNDEVEEAEADLGKGNSPFHKLGRATILLLRATLGCEKDIMEQASTSLAEAEEAALEHQRRAIRDPAAVHQSSIYPIGSEYALCHAESQLMLAGIAVLNESLFESLRGFQKLRTAFGTLQIIREAEKKYLESRDRDAASSQTSAKGSTPPSWESAPSTGSGAATPSEGNSDQEFTDAKEELSSSTVMSNGEGHSEFPSLVNLDRQYAPTGQLNDSLDNTTVSADTATKIYLAADESDDDLDFRNITTDPIDTFIHSGTGLCLGLLQLMLSMVPPAFSKLLSLFSFRGDREAGLRMLWLATKFKHNINGALSGFVTLEFHHGAVAFCDILPEGALPKRRLKSLLHEMRSLYPKSKLWLLEEGRMLGTDRQLEKAVEVLAQTGKSPLKQIEALRVFDRSLYSMYIHRYEDCAASFVQCVQLNNWSHGLYYYIAGACYVELYRIHKASNPKYAEECAAKADEYLHLVPDNAGKKRFMARQLPFDTFVLRKITKWQHRVKTRGCRFVDAIGVSPVEEMTYLWSGYKRMSPSHLRASLERLAWSEDLQQNPHWVNERADEKATLSLLQGVCRRFLGQTSEAKSIFTSRVLNYSLAQLKMCAYPDTWPLPVAHYEVAVCLWQEAGGQDGDAAALQKCSMELAKVEKWESFDLEARVGLKVTTARNSLRRCGVGNA